MTSETVRVAYGCRQPAVEFFLNYEMDVNQAQSRQTTGLVQADFVWHRQGLNCSCQSRRLSRGRFSTKYLVRDRATLVPVPCGETV